MAARLTELGIVSLTLLGWLAVLYTLLALPVSAGSQSILYTAGLVALAGTVALVLELGSWRQGAQGRQEGAVRFLGSGMRFALALEFALWLQSLRMLTIPYMVVIAAGFIFVEFLFHQVKDRAGQ